MTHSPADAAPPRHDDRRPPRRTPRAVFAIEAILLALATAVLLDVLALPVVPRLLVTVGVLVAVFALAFRSQLRCWGTLFATSFAPSRFAVVIVGGSMAFLLANFPESVGLSARIGLALVTPVLMVALLAWDDADTVAKLREEQEKLTRGDGTAPSRV